MKVDSLSIFTSVIDGPQVRRTNALESDARVRFELPSGERVLFTDPRRFGTGVVLLGSAARDEYFAARLGPEPLDPAFTTDVLRAMAAGRRAPVKAFLLSQERIAGVGNIYADEALWRARIHPLRPVGTLKRPQIEALRGGVVESLEAGIDARGASIDDFRHPDGARGSFQDRFLVHRREGEPCPRRRPRHLRLRALPAEAAGQAGAISVSRIPARSASSSSRKPPIARSPTRICGKVIWPVRATRLARPMGSFARLTSS